MWPHDPPVLSAAGITLRAPEDADIGLIAKACADPDIVRFTPVPDPYTESDAQDFLAVTRQQWAEHSGAHFAVCDLTGLLGMCSLVRLDQTPGQGEIGYWMAPWARGKGAAAQAVRLLSEWGHRELGLDPVFAMIEEANSASIRVVMAAGFQPQEAVENTELRGTMRQFRRYDHQS